MIKAIFFDLYGTLAGFKPSRYEIQSQACDKFGISLTQQGVLRGYGQAEYERRIIRGSGIDVDLETAGEIWNTVRAIPYDMTIFEDVWPVLEELRSRDICLGLLSNMNRSGSELLDEFLSKHMQFAVTSLELGVEKPNPLMFKKALEVACVSELEAVHVGDQIGSDVDGAENSGLRPILIDRDGNHSGFSRCLRISNMGQLLDALNSLAEDFR